MAEIRKKVCDRCGKEIKYVGWTTLFRNVPEPLKMSFYKLLNGNPDGYSYVTGGGELCSECTKEFEEWWKEGKNNG